MGPPVLERLYGASEVRNLEDTILWLTRSTTVASSIVSIIHSPPPPTTPTPTARASAHQHLPKLSMLLPIPSCRRLRSHRLGTRRSMRTGCFMRHMWSCTLQRHPCGLTYRYARSSHRRRYRIQSRMMHPCNHCCRQQSFADATSCTLSFAGCNPGDRLHDSSDQPRWDQRALLRLPQGVPPDAAHLALLRLCAGCRDRRPSSSQPKHTSILSDMR